MWPCCNDLIYLRGVPFPYKIAHSILRPIPAKAIDRAIRNSWFAFPRRTSFSIIDSAHVVDLFGL